MTTDRKEDGVRIKVKMTGEPGTALYGPHKRFGKYWPGFSGTKVWLLPVRLDEGGEVRIYAPEELEPGPPRRAVHAPRRVRHLWTGQEGSALTQEIVDGVIWPGWDATGSWRIPVEVDGKATTWELRHVREPDTAPKPKPSPVQAPVGPQGGPRVMVRGDKWPASRLGRVLYRWAGIRDESRIWPDFAEPDFADGKWLVPVRMEATGGTHLVLATDLEPLTEPREDEGTILAEADKVANAIQAKALREVAGAAADALELFTDRLRAIVAQEGGGA